MSPDAPFREPIRPAFLIESDGPGGAERMVAQLATELAQAGMPGVVFVPAHGEGWLEAELAGSGVAVEHFSIPSPLSPGAVERLVAGFRRHRITVAHSHEFTMAVYGACAARRVGVPHVITLHGGRYYAQRARRRLALRVAIALSRDVVAVSRQLATELRDDLHLPADRVTVIPNGVRPAPPAHPRLRSELRLPGRDRLVLAVGSLYPVKGHRYLIEALARLGPTSTPVHLAIAGRGLLAPDLGALASRLGVGDRVHLLGLRADVGALLAAADLFVMPSLNEGLPLALLEAMFAGRPIVASAVGEVPTVLAGGEAGVLVPPGEPGALADAMAALLGDPDRAELLGARAAEEARRHYSITRMVEAYAAIYERVTGTPSLGPRARAETMANRSASVTSEWVGSVSSSRDKAAAPGHS